MVKHGRNPPRLGVPLTRLEWVVLCLWVSGANRQQIGASLGTAPETAKSTIKRVSVKLGIVGGVMKAIERFPSVPRPEPADTPDMKRGG